MYIYDIYKHNNIHMLLPDSDGEECAPSPGPFGCQHCGCGECEWLSGTGKVCTACGYVETGQRAEFELDLVLQTDYAPVNLRAGAHPTISAAARRQLGGGRSVFRSYEDAKQIKKVGIYI